MDTQSVDNHQMTYSHRRKRDFRIIECLLVFLFACLVLSSIHGQIDQEPSFYETSPEPHRMIGMNMTPLLVQLIPFNRSNPKFTGPFYISARKYTKGDKAYRFGFGLDIDPNGDEEAIEAFLNLRFGWQKQKVISGRWSYYGGLDAMLIGGDLNLPEDKPEETGALGFAPIWGFEYALTEHVRLSTELALFLGIGFGDFGGVPKFEFIPPVSIFLNFKLPPKKKKRKR